ncbi:hypothetical protein MRB53_038022 [Persea americana]|nr:hypothetical protein MRB53_038022 [Persea americana]
MYPRLPNELLLEIISYLRCHKDGEVGEERRKLCTLRSLSLASRTLHSMTRESLYSTIVVPDLVPYKSLGRLLRVLTASSELPALVKHLAITRLPSTEERERSTGSDVLAFKHMYKYFDGHKLPEGFMQALRDASEADHEDYQLALLLCICTRIRILTVFPLYQTCPETVCYKLLAELSAETLAQPHGEGKHRNNPYSSLAEVRVKCSEQSLFVDMSKVDSVLNFPSIRKLKVVSDYGSSLHFHQLPASSSLTFPCLKGVDIKPSALGKVLFACPSLRTLHDHTRCMLSRKKSPGFAISDDRLALGQSLGILVPRLERLKISPEVVRGAVWWTCLSILAVKGLQSLKTLLLTYEHLFKLYDDLGESDHLARILPTSITTLVCLPEAQQELRIQQGLDPDTAQERDPERSRDRDMQIWSLMNNTDFAVLRTVCICRNWDVFIPDDCGPWRHYTHTEKRAGRDMIWHIYERAYRRPI